MLLAPDNRITNGADADEGEWPFIGSMQRVTTDFHFCGASLINEQWAVTAAHCLYVLQTVTEETVVRKKITKGVMKKNFRIIISSLQAIGRT